MSYLINENSGIAHVRVYRGGRRKGRIHTLCGREKATTIGYKESHLPEGTLCLHCARMMLSDERRDFHERHRRGDDECHQTSQSGVE